MTEKPAKKTRRGGRVNVWIQSHNGCMPHELPERIAASSVQGITWGHTFQVWSSALPYIRELMAEGFSLHIYQEER